MSDTTDLDRSDIVSDVDKSDTKSDSNGSEVGAQADDNHGTRTRGLTERGQEFFESMKVKHISNLNKAWEVVSKKIETAKKCNDDSLLKLQSTLLSDFESYRSISSGYIAFLSRIGTKCSQDELCLHLEENNKKELKVGKIVRRLGERKDNLSEVMSSKTSARQSSRSRSRKSSISGKTGSHISTIIAKTEAKAGAARVAVQYAKKEADINRRKAEFDAELNVLRHKKHAAEAEAELLALKSTSDSASHRDLPLSVADPVERTCEYVERHTQPSTEKGFNKEPPDPQIILNPDTTAFVPGPSASGDSTSEKQVQPQALPVLRDITSENQLQPQAPFVINDNALKKPVKPDVQEFSSVAEISRFLLKKDLMLSRLSSYDDQPGTYRIWKNSFKCVMEDLQATATEELDLMTKWLGPESSKLVASLRSANSKNAQKAIECMWVRLDERYGSPEIVEAALKSKLAKFPKLTNRDNKKLYDLSDILTEIQTSMEDVQYNTVLAYYNSSSGVTPIVNKLPYGIQEKWTNHASSYKRTHSVPYPPFHIFVKFIDGISKIRNDPSFVYESYDVRNKKDVGQSFKVLSRKTEVKDSSPKHLKQIQCPIHKTSHSLRQCRTFKTMSIQERRDLLKKSGFCFKCCVTSEHMSRDCKEKLKCEKCESTNHITEMHFSKETQASKTQSEEETNETGVKATCTKICGKGFSGKSCGKTILVRVYPKDPPDQAMVTYAILDDQSNASLAKPEFFDHFNITGTYLPYTLTSCAGQIQANGRRANGFVIEGLDGHSKLNVPYLTECPDIPDNREEIPTPQVALHHAHLVDIADFIPPIDSRSDMLLLIGRDMPEAHHVLDQRIGPVGSPYAQKLPFGWVIIGEACLGKNINVNKINLLENGRTSYFEPCSYNLRIKDDMANNVFNRTKEDEKMSLSIEDRLFLDVMDSTFYKNSGGNWTAPLPFRPGRPRLPNNRAHALKRLNILQRSLDKKPETKERFLNFMGKIFDSGHAEAAPPLGSSDECWYLPMFGVYHPKKPGKIRVVFDSSAQYQGISLNSVLLPGPDLVNNLLGVLLRFRRGPVAIMADIQQMFHCFHVDDKCRDFLRFLWYKNNDPEEDIIEYRMCVHVFGNTTSPAIATYGLRKTAEAASKTYGKDVENFVARNFYVDDGLISCSSDEEAVDLMTRTQHSLLLEGNLRLHKIASNSPKVMSAFPSEDYANDLKNLDFNSESIPLQRSLGMIWNLKDDTFLYRLSLEEKEYTRRGILSTINSLFDPLGCVCPVLIKGKILLRELMQHTTDWDEPLPAERRHEWESWRDSLVHLETLKIPRAYTPAALDDSSKIELHVYCDASELAIAAVAYLRTFDHSNAPSISFVMGKAKVAPKHGHTIPRLELCAAVLGVELSELVIEELDVELNKVFFYTDSKIVMGYIHNQVRRFHVYVANRVARIRKSTVPDQWHYISTNENSADLATRGVEVSVFESSSWLSGPKSLRRSEAIDNTCTYPLEDPDCDADIKSEVVSKATCIVGAASLGSERFKRFSSWSRLVRAIGNLKYFILSTLASGDSRSNDISLTDACIAAEKFIIREVQHEVYSKEIKSARESKPIPKSSSLINLSPFLDEVDMLRVAGRIKHAVIPVDEKHPLILPKNHHITTLLIQHHHAEVNHQGRLFTEGAIRAAGLWIVGCKRLIPSLINKCVTCRKLRRHPETQRMADLPADRLAPGAPFSNVGIDVFGPWLVVARRTRGGQANNKRWAVIFTCLVIRAIHRGCG